MKIAFLDCFSGISGDMFLGALLDAGLPLEDLTARLKTLPLSGYDLQARRAGRHQIFGTQVQIRVHDKAHMHRGLGDIRDIISSGDLSEWVRTTGIRLFETLARVEGAIHDISPEAVHFHEVGAVDSILDMVGTLYGIEQLGIPRLYASPLPLGSGLMTSAHGAIPIPAPATMALLQDVPVFDAGVDHELVTPTGAVLVKELTHAFGPMPAMKVHQIGYGVGTRDLADRPNLLRILLGETEAGSNVESIVVLETNLDDVSPEILGYLMERLFEAGALDVVFFPVHMKKNRPGVQLQVMGRPDQKALLTELIAQETATLGVRFHYTQRSVFERARAEVDSPWGKIKVKRIVHEEGKPFLAPEYDACKQIAHKHNIPLRRVVHWVLTLNRPFTA